MRITLLLLSFFTAVMPALVEAQPVVTVEDYTRAESFLSGQTDSLVSGVVTSPAWLNSDRLVYQNRIPEGREFVMADPEGVRARAFDHAKMAAALSAAVNTGYSAFNLPTQARFSDDGASITFGHQERQYTCIIETYACHEVARLDAQNLRNAVIAPDGQRAAFIRKHNLWMRDLTSGRETQLTTDGIEHYGYATNNAGWVRRDQPVVLWSPDSEKIATFQHDGRFVGEMYLVSTQVGIPN